MFEKISELGNDIIQKLALTSTVTAINALQTNSWFGQLLKMVLTASGVKYNIAQNGYVCLGSFFGGLIIQWGNGDVSGTSAIIQFPVNFGKCFQILAGDVGSGAHPLGASGTNTTATIYNASATSVTYRWIAVGKS